MKIWGSAKIVSLSATFCVLLILCRLHYLFYEYPSLWAWASDTFLWFVVFAVIFTHITYFLPSAVFILPPLVFFATFTGIFLAFSLMHTGPWAYQWVSARAYFLVAVAMLLRSNICATIDARCVMTIDLVLFHLISTGSRLSLYFYFYASFIVRMLSWARYVSRFVFGIIFWSLSLWYFVFRVFWHRDLSHGGCLFREVPFRRYPIWLV